MSERYESALEKLNGTIAALHLLDESLKDVGDNNATVLGVRTIIRGLEDELDQVFNALRQVNVEPANN